MSIHKSKGLEFSYVFLPQLQKISIAGKGGAKICQFDSTNLQVGLRFPVDISDKYEASALYNNIREENRKLDEYESLRVLYVAMTRARDVLILSGTRTSSKESTMNNALEWLINYAPPECQTLDCSALADNNISVTEGTDILDESTCQMVMHKCVSLCQSQNCLDRLTASAIHDYQLCPTLFKYRHVIKLPDLSQPACNTADIQSENNTLIGTVVHALLEGTEELSIAHPIFSELTVQEATRVLSKAQTLFSSYINSNLYHSIQPYIQQKEYSFALFSKAHKLMLNGIVDCVLLMPDGTLGIVDYKTGQQVQEHLEFYKLQLCLYADVLQEIWNKRVSYLAIHHISGQISEIQLPSSEYLHYQQQLNTLIQEIVAATAQGELSANTEHCSLCSYAYLCPLFRG